MREIPLRAIEEAARAIYDPVVRTPLVRLAAGPRPDGGFRILARLPLGGSPLAAPGEEE